MARLAPCCRPRWLASRVKRLLRLAAFLGFLLMVIVGTFALLNSPWHRQKLLSAGSSALGLGPGPRFRTQRPMAQYYPENMQGRRRSDDQDLALAYDYDNPSLLGVLLEQEDGFRAVAPEPTTTPHPTGVPFDGVHAFYYAWYRSHTLDGVWSHWDEGGSGQVATGRSSSPSTFPRSSSSLHDPDLGDIASSFFPVLGPYSSGSAKVIETHLAQCRKAGISVVVVSWLPPSTAATGPRKGGHQVEVDTLMPGLLGAALKAGMQVAVRLEHYEGRTVETVRDDIEYLHEHYVGHPAFFKASIEGTAARPVHYIHDSYRIQPESWRRLLAGDGDLTIRGGRLDAWVLGLLVDFQHRGHIRKSSFDGFYTCYTSNGGFSHGSILKNWASLMAFAQRSNLLFVPSLGPGYEGTRANLEDQAGTRPRRQGQYYNLAWRTVAGLNPLPRFIAINSFNGWKQGTQIEPAAPSRSISTPRGNFTYLDYGPGGPDTYIKLTRTWVGRLGRLKVAERGSQVDLMKADHLEIHDNSRPEE